jgi:hypothetical protein
MAGRVGTKEACAQVDGVQVVRAGEGDRERFSLTLVYVATGPSILCTAAWYVLRDPYITHARTRPSFHVPLVARNVAWYVLQVYKSCIDCRSRHVRVQLASCMCVYICILNIFLMSTPCHPVPKVRLAPRSLAPKLCWRHAPLRRASEVHQC